MIKNLSSLYFQSIISDLTKIRGIFHSEADFQHSLGLLLSKKYNFQVRLETPFELPHYDRESNKKLKVELDIFIPKEKIGIELKYKTKEGIFEKHGETFKLKQHGAQNLGRFDYFDDIRRLQFLKKHGIIEKGYAVFLTNDPLYWKPIKGKNFSSNFSMENERIIESNTKLGWTGNPSEGSVTKKRLFPNNPIILDNKHQLKWYEFSKLSGVSFKYLIIEI